MSQIDFQNGFAVGMALGGKNGAVGGVTPNLNALKNMIVVTTLLPEAVSPITMGNFILITPTVTTLTQVTL